MMGNFTKKHRWSVLVTFVFTISSFLASAQSSGSFGNTFVHTNEEMGIFVQHNFLNGGSGILPGIVGTERNSPKGFLSFNTGSSWLAASSAAYTDGYVMTRQAGAFTFPIGDNGAYRPAAVSASSPTAPASAAYFGIDGTLAITSSLKGGNEPILPTGVSFPTTTKATDVGVVDNVEYWDIDGTTPARITLTWDINTPISTMVGSNLNNLTIVGWDGTKWVNIPSTVDASSLLQNTSASAYTGPASIVSAGSITTNAAIVPGSYTVYTLAGACPITSITPSLTSLSICSGDEVAIIYTTIPSGAQVIWSRNPGTGSSLGNVIDFPTAIGTTPVNYTYTASITPTIGCPASTTTTVVTVNPQPVITPSTCSQTICSGQTGAITFVSSIPGSTINWLRVEDNQTGTGNISSLFASAGTFTYKIWGVSAAPASCPSSTTITCVIVVNTCAPPCSLIVSGSASQTAVCVGQSINLTSTVSGNAGPVTYAWIGPNGFTSNVANPSIPSATSAMSGIYTLTVTDPTASTACIQTTTVPITVASPMVAALSNSPLCSGSTLLLSATSGFTGYAWTGPAGFASNQQNATLPGTTTAASGLYTVTATDAAGCTASASTTVVIATQPSLSITAGSGLTICSGQSTSLAVAGNGGAPVIWTNSLGQSGTGSTINFAGIMNVSQSPQTITYVISANAGSCSDSKTVTLTINPAPTLQVIPLQAVVCALEQTTVVATAQSPTATINWTRTPATPAPASGTGTGSVTVNEVLPAGTYTYSFTATQGGCDSSVVNSQVVVNN